MTEEFDVSRMTVVCKDDAKQELAKIIREYRGRHSNHEITGQLDLKKVSTTSSFLKWEKYGRMPLKHFVIMHKNIGRGNALKFIGLKNVQVRDRYNRQEIDYNLLKNSNYF